MIDIVLMYCRDWAAAYRPQNAILAHGDPQAANILLVSESEDPQFKFIEPDGLAIEPTYDLGLFCASGMMASPAAMRIPSPAAMSTI